MKHWMPAFGVVLLACSPTTQRGAQSIAETVTVPAVPKTEDHDHDGLSDALDRCPDEPEDCDRWADGDGCPDPDNDQDQVVDACDVCPNQPGVSVPMDGRWPARGCPFADSFGYGQQPSASMGIDPCGPDAATPPAPASCESMWRERLQTENHRLWIVPVDVQQPVRDIALPALATVENDEKTGLFLQRALRPGDNEIEVCRALRVAMLSHVVSTQRVLCGGVWSTNAQGNPVVVALRTYTLQQQVFWSDADVLGAERFYDEDVSPLHAHLKLRVKPEVWQRPGARSQTSLAVVLGDRVEGLQTGIWEHGTAIVTLEGQVGNGSNESRTIALEHALNAHVAH